MYVAEYGNKRVQVLDSSGHFIRAIGEEGEGKLSRAFSVFITDQDVYVTAADDHIVVYKTSGQLVTSLRKYGQKEVEFCTPFYITSCTNGYIYVADHYNNRVQVF